jgi:hypothetical protein
VIVVVNLGFRIPTTDSVREARLRATLRSVDLLGPEERAERRAKNRAKRKEMERERKKAIRAAYRRVREAKRKKEPEVRRVQKIF